MRAVSFIDALGDEELRVLSLDKPMTILDERELTAEERAAIADEPRPGIWLEQIAPHQSPPPLLRGDAQVLDQDQTDALIVRELVAANPALWRSEFRQIAHIWLTPMAPLWITDSSDERHVASQQRGGIHSEQAVRLYAFRAWADRDRRWFDVSGERLVCRHYGFDAVQIGRLSDDFTFTARVGDAYEIGTMPYWVPEGVDWFERCREELARLAQLLHRAAVDGGPSDFDLYRWLKEQLHDA